MKPRDEHEVAQLVQSFLDRNQPEDYRLRVDVAGVRREDDWWYVLVKPDREDVRSHDYAERLSDAEEQIETRRIARCCWCPF
jgi:hypothetical protein